MPRSFFTISGVAFRTSGSICGLRTSARSLKAIRVGSASSVGSLSHSPLTGLLSPAGSPSTLELSPASICLRHTYGITRATPCLSATSAAVPSRLSSSATARIFSSSGTLRLPGVAEGVTFLWPGASSSIHLTKHSLLFGYPMARMVRARLLPWPR